MRHTGPYSALATAAHDKRETGKREEQREHLCLLVADAVEEAKRAYLAMGIAKEPDTPQMGKVFAYLYDAGQLLVEMQERDKA